MRFRSGQVVENLHARNARVHRALVAGGGRLGAYGDDIHGSQGFFTVPELRKDFSTNSWDSKLNAVWVGESA
jgi:hypothetical protein